MPGRRLLVVSYCFPPDRSVGALRWHAMTNWLRRLGHEVTVLTTRAFGELPDDDARIQRSFDLTSAGGLRRLLHRPPLAERGASAEIPAPAVFTEVLVPDALVLGWVPAAIRAARRLARRRRIDCVITSGPPHSTHMIPLAMGRRRPAWIADFRDGWRFEPLRDPWPTRAQEGLDARLERWVVSRADGVIGVTRPIAEDLSNRLGARAAYIPNGWNPELEASADAASPPALSSRTVNVVHTGRLSDAHGRRDPGALRPVLERLLARRPDAAQRLRIVVAGPDDSEEMRILAEIDPGGMIDHLGPLPRDQALALQRRADALLLLTAPGYTSLATGKLYEYLAAGRPIIALAEGNDAARVVRETGAGLTLAPGDVEAVSEALEAALDGELGRSFAPHDLEPYVYPHPAKSVGDLVEGAITRHVRAGK